MQPYIYGMLFPLVGALLAAYTALDRLRKGNKDILFFQIAMFVCGLTSIVLLGIILIVLSAKLHL